MAIGMTLRYLARRKTKILIGIVLLFLYTISMNLKGEQLGVSLFPSMELRPNRNLTNGNLELTETNHHSKHGINDSKEQPATIQTSWNVLSLGGSTTWGFQLESRDTEAYPYLIPPDPHNAVVVNIAVRATGADYASQCIQSMVEEALTERNLPLDLQFDVITLEYSLNGLDGLHLLLSRLSAKYPKARFVYVHLWSLRMSVKDDVTKTFPRHILNQPNVKKLSQADELINQALENPKAQWVWDEPTFDVSNQLLQTVESILQRIPAETYIWFLPRAKIPKNMFSWFSPNDRHHLSTIGHQKVAEGIQTILKNHGLPNPIVRNTNKHDDNGGTWGLGDQCLSWFQDGKSPSFVEHSKPLKMFVKPDKWALHISQDDGIVTTKFENKAKWTMPLSLVHMAWRNPSIYPKSNIKITSLEEQNNHDTKYTLLDPLHRNEAFHIYHVTQTTLVGEVLPGKNELSIEPIEKTDKPLRITGIVMCGACMEMNDGGKNTFQ